jgi:hypothetical protein
MLKIMAKRTLRNNDPPSHDKPLMSDPYPPLIPPFLRRHQKVWGFASIPIVLCMLACLPATDPDGFHGIHLGTAQMCAILVGLSVADIVLCYVLVIRVLIRVMHHDYYVCLHCGYPLEGLDEEGICPECGRAYYVSSTKELWMLECSRSFLLHVYRACMTARRWFTADRSKKGH